MNMRELSVNLQPSSIFIILLSILMLGSLICVKNLVMAVEIKIILVIFIVIYSGYVIWRYGLLKSSRAIIGLSFNSDSKKCRITTHSEILSAELSGDSLVTTQLCILQFVVPGKKLKQACIIFKDSLGKDAYRRLLVALKSVNFQD